MLAALKRAMFGISEQVGLTGGIASSEWRRQRLLVLCYHGVSLADEHEWNPELYISPATLSRRLDSLTRMGCTVLPLPEAIDRLYAGTLPDRAVVLTFDDGFYDFKAAALPLIEARGYPVTLYVTTHRCDLRIPVAHLLTSYLVWKHAHRLASAPPARGKRLHPEDEGRFAPEVMDRFGIDDGVARLQVLCAMTCADIAEVADHGVAIEMHTHRHRSPEDAGDFIEEVRQNRERIYAITGHRPQHLCYPDGRYWDAYFPKLERERVQTATTCDPGLASRGSHPLLLPRFIDNETVPQATFEAWVAGLACWLPRRTRRAHVLH
jgi:peptidoglycan/xylan/chitin deacetylase (PgdA/CDA1 family)